MENSNQKDLEYKFWTKDRSVNQVGPSQSTGCSPSTTPMSESDSFYSSVIIPIRYRILCMEKKLENLEHHISKVIWNFLPASEDQGYLEYLDSLAHTSPYGEDLRRTPSTTPRKTTTIRRLDCPARPVKARGPTSFRSLIGSPREPLLQRLQESTQCLGSDIMEESPPSTPPSVPVSPLRRYTPLGGPNQF